MSMQKTQSDGAVSWMVSKNFKLSEVTCKHCGSHGMQKEFIDLLQQFRDFLGAPIVITSGYRCANHPVEAARKGKVGRHRMGVAVDFYSPGISLKDLYGKIIEFGRFLGVGVSLEGGFIHCDRRETKARWKYKGGKDVAWDGRWEKL